jgi:hypothetical protein
LVEKAETDRPLEISGLQMGINIKINIKETGSDGKSWICMTPIEGTV